MSNFHPNFPWGKGMWIHDIGQAGNTRQESTGELGALSKYDSNNNTLYKATFNDIIKKLTDNGFSYVLIKTADGDFLYPGGQSQLTKEMVDACHAAGLKVYSWSYVYGADPEREGRKVLYCIEQLGVDGHIFDAEIEWEKLPNPSTAAETMLKTVRDRYPNFFLAHAPFPIIDYHTAFPYVMFGKYCDAVMPQMYWNDIGIDVETMIADTFNQWSKWQNNWTASGHGDSVKPIIPLGMSYDIADRTPPAIMTPGQLVDFVSGVAGYGSVNFWVMEYTIRDDLWGALKNTPIKPKEQVDPSLVNSQNAAPTQPSTQAPVAPATPSTPVVQPNAQPQNPPAQTQPQSTTVTPGSTTGTNSAPATVAKSQPFTAPAVVNIKKDPTSPSGVKLQVIDHKPHIDYIIDFINLIISFFNRTNKGGESK